MVPEPSSYSFQTTCRAQRVSRVRMAFEFLATSVAMGAGGWRPTT